MTKSKKGSSAALLILVLVILIPIGLVIVAQSAPIQLAIVQETVLGMMHNGIRSTNETEDIEGCAEFPTGGGGIQYRAVRRITRTTQFGDGAKLVVVYRYPPQPTQTQCP